MVTKDASGVKFNVYPARTTSRSLTSSMVDMTKTAKLIRITHLLNTALIANVILLSNDVQLNPGPQEMKGLRFFHLNICSLRNKVDELRLFCDMHKPHVLSVNETWLDESFSDEEVRLPGFNLLRKDRDCHSGGLAVYIVEHLSFKRLDYINSEIMGTMELEMICFELSQPK